MKILVHQTPSALTSIGRASRIKQTRTNQSQASERLKEENSVLKAKVKELSQALESTLNPDEEVQNINGVMSSPCQSRGGLNLDRSQSQSEITRFDALHSIIKEKNNQVNAYQNAINSLKKDKQRLISKTMGTNEMQYALQQLDDLTQKLNHSERLNDELRSEIIGLKRIQSEQGNALYKITNDNKYPQKIKGLLDELKYAKDKVKELEESAKREAKFCMQLQITNGQLNDML